jgi:hypothetical protein
MTAQNRAACQYGITINVNTNGKPSADPKVTKTHMNFASA